MRSESEIKARLDRIDYIPGIPDYVNDKNEGWEEALEWVLEKSENINYRKICNYVACSDSEDNQYPECDMQNSNKCSLRKYLEFTSILNGDE